MSRYSETDVEAMETALAEARRALPSPAPPVGAVILDAGGAIVATAAQERADEAATEVMVLAAAAERADGGTLVLTLEPADTELAAVRPAGLDAILRSNVRRVVIGAQDPYPELASVAGARLAEAGFEVSFGLLGAECGELVAPWGTFVTQQRPHVALKLALSLDGRIATRSGASKWVTGPEARQKVQELRAERDAVAVGIGTVLADDPLLTVREAPAELIDRSPARIVFDSHLRTPLNARLVTSASEVGTLIIAGGDAPEESEAALVERGCAVLRVPNTAEGRVDMAAALHALAAHGIVSLLVEGGAELAGSLLAAGLADELHAFLAPMMLGPRGRPGAVDWAGPDTPNEAPHIVDPAWEVCGRDAYVYGPLAFPVKT